MIKPSLSIVIPTLNEEQGLPLLLKDLRAIDTSPGFLEILVVDGGSRDNTREIAEEFGARLLIAPPSRGGQLQTGFLASQSQMLWFLHADSRVDSTCWEALEPLVGSPGWGRFDVRLGDAPVPLGFRIIARVMNLRSCFTCIATGDQGIFVARELIEQIGGVPEQPLMEDVELSLRLRRLAPPTCLRASLETSRRRWDRGGLVRTTWQMLRLRSAYALGASAESLFVRYYKRGSLGIL